MHASETTLGKIARSSTRLLSLLSEDPLHDRREPLPRLRALFKMFQTSWRERVIPRLPVVVGRTPRRLDQAPLLETNQGCIDRALVQKNLIPADLLDPPGDAVAVLRPHCGERLENHQVERALQEIQFIVHACSCVRTT